MKTLKALLIILLVLQIFLGSWCFIALLPQSMLTALLFLFLAVLQTALTFVVIIHCNQQEDIWFEIERLRHAVRELQKSAEADKEITYFAVNHGDLAKSAWECIKCGTVNKEKTTYCIHCGAAYVTGVYPTDDASEKRKMSRWIKEDKKKSLFGKQPKL